MNKREKEETFESKMIGAIARGYCTKENENKVLDSSLCIAILNEVMPEVQQEIDRSREEGKKEGLAELLKFVKQWDKKYQMNKAQELEQFISKLKDKEE